jgi:IS1 family transposase
VSPTYVGNKKNKIWLLYAYCPENQEIVAYLFSDRCGWCTTEKIIKELYTKLAENKIIVDEFCTDNWKAFAKILLGGIPPKNKHKVGKKYTKNLEGNNRGTPPDYIRSRNRKTVRKTCGFSKKLENNKAAMKIFILKITIIVKKLSYIFYYNRKTHSVWYIFLQVIFMK